MNCECPEREEGKHENCPVIVSAALNAGIPLAVILGHAKLTDFFSKEYIDHMCNRWPDE